MWYASTSSMGTLRYGTSKGRRSVSGCCQTPGTARALAKAGRSKNHRDGAFRLRPLYWARPRSSYPTSSVALNFTPLKCCARASVVRSCPSPVGWAQLFLKRGNNIFLFAAPASLIGSELSSLLGSGPSLCPTPNTRESGHLAYKDAPFGVCAPVLLGTTICSIVKPGALRDYPAPRVPRLFSGGGPGPSGAARWRLSHLR